MTMPLDGSGAGRTNVGAEPAGGDRRPGAARIGFGCAGLMQSPSARHRQRLLTEAFDRGVRHFDVARMYGLGAAERELGQFARGRRDQLVIATKFGIEAAGPAGSLAGLQAPARALIARFPALRRALKRRADAFHQPHRYDPATARASLQTSLRELGTDYVDIFFVHGPEPADPLDLAQLSETLEECRRAGLLRSWGFAGDPQPCIALHRAATQPTVLQIRDDIFEQSAAAVGEQQPAITFGVLAGALERVLRHLSSSAERRTRWSQAVAEDCGRPEIVARLLLQDALARNLAGTVLFSTTRPERIAGAMTAAATLAAEPDMPSLAAFRELVRAELAPTPHATHG